MLDPPAPAIRATTNGGGAPATLTVSGTTLTLEFDDSGGGSSPQVLDLTAPANATLDDLASQVTIRSSAKLIGAFLAPFDPSDPSTLLVDQVVTIVSEGGTGDLNAETP